MLSARHETYRAWLFSLVGRENKYSELLSHLYEREFTYTVAMDENRAERGKYLRVRFEQETGTSMDDYPYWPCSILEMLIALARDVEDKLMRDWRLHEDRMRKWFWMFISNLSLDKYTNSAIGRSRRKCYEEIDSKLDFFMFRRYGRYGIGSLFPAPKNYVHFLSKNCPNVQKSGQNGDFLPWNRVELWMQANFWSMEEGEN